MIIAVEFLLTHLSMSPGLAVVAAAVDAIDLDADPDGFLVARIYNDVGDLGCSGQASLGDRNRELLPGSSSIRGSENCGRLSPEKKYVGIVGMKRNRPNLFSVGWRLNHVPLRAVIFAQIEAALGAGQQVRRIMRRDGERSNLNLTGLGVEGKLHPAAAPMIAAVGAEPNSGANRADTNREILIHRHDLSMLSQGIASTISDARSRLSNRAYRADARGFTANEHLRSI